MSKQKRDSSSSAAEHVTDALSKAGYEQASPIPEATAATPEHRVFFEALSRSQTSALLLDFDGTLAPFRLDPATVRPWAGVSALLDKIQQTGRTRIVLISGRPAQDVATQLGLAQTPEVWGLHGAEHLLPDGRIEYEKLPRHKRLELKAAHKVLEDSGWLARPGVRLEAKWNAVVVHWRGLPETKAKEAYWAIHELLVPISSTGALEMLIFDGGIELRAGRTKGDSVHLVLSAMDHETPTAYLGDDTTDEFAFRTLNAEAAPGRSLSILVRRQWRPTAAHLWIRPPAGLRTFLRDWLRSVESCHG